MSARSPRQSNPFNPTLPLGYGESDRLDLCVSFFPPNSVDTLGVLAVVEKMQLRLDRCAARPCPASSLRFAVHSCLSKSSTAQARRIWGPRRGSTFALLGHSLNKEYSTPGPRGCPQPLSPCQSHMRPPNLRGLHHLVRATRGLQTSAASITLSGPHEARLRGL